jgi:hypothetical protein
MFALDLEISGELALYSLFSKSIFFRERREVPPPAKIIQRRAPVERHQSVKG